MMFSDRRVLVVEDNFLVSLGTTDMLESMGCAIVGPATSLTAACLVAESESLDAAILDIDICGEVVWPVAEELQRRKIPFLFLSAHRQAEGVPVPFAAAPHLQKPLEQSRLLGALAALWAHSCEARAISPSTKAVPRVPA